MNYTGSVYSIEQSNHFADWLAGLRDSKARLRITARIVMAGEGNFGDCEPVGEGVHEMRIHVGAGYRAYFIYRGRRMVFLLCGGDKASQKRDITKAKDMAKALG